MTDPNPQAPLDFDSASEEAENFEALYARLETIEIGRAHV